MNTRFKLLLLLLLGVLSLVSISILGGIDKTEQKLFDGNRALRDVETQLSFGPRYPGSQGHTALRSWLSDELIKSGWQVEVQEGEFNGFPIYNLIGTRPGVSKSEKFQIILGAHYDTRFFADEDLDSTSQEEPVPGANDGASGVAVLVELARILPAYPNIDLTLVFFDAEDNGGFPGWDWVIGSRFFVENLEFRPDAVVIVDMVGDIDQNIYIEKTSSVDLAAEIWTIANDLGIVSFIPKEKHSILDDHTPFLAEGIAAVDIIDIEYSFWHTTEDTLDKVSAESLRNVGVVLDTWLRLKDDGLGD